MTLIAIVLGVVALLFVASVVFSLLSKQDEPQPTGDTMWVKFPEGTKVQKIGETKWGNSVVKHYRPIFRIEYEGKVYLAVDQGGIIRHK